MATKWTDEQERVISQRNSDLLVSAAAGSGKTAVLVERIMQLVMDPVSPMDIDQLLVVTFTRAAAGEMKERIGAKFAALLEEDPENDHLQQQGVLLHHALITTIDGFCTHVIQNYFQRIGLDPGYRIAEEGELSLLRGQVLDDLLEEEYAEARPEFLRLTQAYAPGKTDRALEEMILDIYSYAMSDPDPEVWLSECVKVYDAKTEEDLQQTGWFREMMGDAMAVLRLQTDRMRGIAEEGVNAFGDAACKTLVADIEMLEALGEATDYQACANAFASLKFGTLRRSKDIQAEDSRWVKITTVRDDVKKQVKELQKNTFGNNIGAIVREFEILRPYVQELVRLVLRFREAFSAEKRKKNIADFNDLEHFALEILLDKDEDGRRTLRTDAAKELAESFREVMIDEYQDSNFLQERILKAVSGDEDGRFNRFMVGDMKQSIYAFRMARPELFLEKFNTYLPDPESTQVRIDLTRNFRSRKEVLDSSNALFRRLMIPEVGGIRYDDKAFLNYKASYPEPADPSFPQTELLVINREEEPFSSYKSPEERMELEAAAVAAKIRNLMAGTLVRGEGDELRPLRYRDIVVLLRSAKRWGKVWVKVLKEAGIPCYALSGEGFFDTIEVATVLNYLRLIDNPRQDIPLAAVLRSAIAGLDDEDLAWIRAKGGMEEGKVPLLYDAVLALAEQDEKLRKFVEQLDDFRARAPRTEVHELIREVLEKTGYGEWAAAMPAGEQREANLKMLIEKAVDYEKTSYHGLFNFIRYIDRLKKYSVDYGEVNLNSEADDTVRIMTIHQSKGLQFPVVFVSALGSEFNKADTTKPVLRHASLGLGLKVSDPEKRVQYPSVYRRVMQSHMKKQMYGEELRVLYVALTRAEEKLILTGQVSDSEKLTAAVAMQNNFRMKRESGQDETVERMLASPMDFTALLSAKTFLEMILAVIPEEKDMKLHAVEAGELAAGEVSEKMQRSAVLEQITGLAKLPEEKKIFDPEVNCLMKEVRAFSYPYEEQAKMPAKLTVTEIKKRAQRTELQEDELPAATVFEPEEEELIPKFLRGTDEEEKTGASRGTVYHHFLECLDYGKLRPGATEEERTAFVEAERKRMLEKGLMTREDDACMYTPDFVRFLACGLGQRMKAASDAGTLHREQPFVMDIPAKDIDSQWPEGENILVQGTIDAYFSEEGKYVLVDYKTDRIHSLDADGNPDERELVEKYHKQLEYYAAALTRITGTEVGEMYIYSVRLGREIKL